jgi:hypothetical protein
MNIDGLGEVRITRPIIIAPGIGAFFLFLAKFDANDNV